MGSRFSIEAVISMLDQVSNPMRGASHSVTAFSRIAVKQTSIANKAFSGLKRTIGGFVGVGAVIALGKQFADFDDAIYGATARFKAAEKPGTNMAVVMQNLRDASRKTGAETQFTAKLMAEGLNKFALAGFTSQEAINSLRTQVDLATVTGEDFIRVADISSDLLGAFGGAALESTKKIAMLKQMNALLAVGTLSANVTMEDLFETLKSAAPIGTQAGAAMDDIIATVSVLGSAGIKGSDAATAMKNMFSRLASPTKEVEKGFAMLGLRQKDFLTNTGKLKNTQGIFKALAETTKGMSDVKTLEVFKNIFGMRGMAGAAVLQKNIGQVRQQLERMGKDPQRVMQETADFMRQSLGNRFKVIISALTEVGFSFIEAFAGPGADGMKNLSDLLLKLVPAVKMLGKFVAALIPYLKYALLLWGLWKVAVIANIVAHKAFLALNFLQFAFKYRGSIGLVLKMTKSWTAAQSALNMVMAANPIGLIVIAVMALIGAIWLLYKNWDVVTADFDRKIYSIAYHIDNLKLKFYEFLDMLGMAKKGRIIEIKAEMIKSAAKVGEAQKLYEEGMKKGIQGIPEFIAPFLPESMKGKGAEQKPINQQGINFASPVSQQIVSNTTNTTNGNLKIDITGPKEYTKVEKKGKFSPNHELNLGLQ